MATTRKGRPLDPGKRIPIIRTISDYKNLFKDTAGRDFAAEWAGFHEGVNAGGSSTVRPAKTTVPIIVPPSSQGTSRQTKTSGIFIRPEHYIRHPTFQDYVSPLQLQDGSLVHYDLLQVDEKFLDEMNCDLTGQKVSETEFIKFIDALEKATARNAPVTFDTAVHIARTSIQLSHPILVLQRIYQFWLSRRTRLGKPLLRQFWPTTAPNDVSPFGVFRPRVKEKMTLRRPRRSTQDSAEKLERLEVDLAAVGIILKKMKQRDEKKLQIVDINCVLFDQQRSMIEDPTYCSPFVHIITGLERGKPVTSHPGALMVDEPMISVETTSDESQGVAIRLGRPCRMVRRHGRGGRLWLDKYTAHETAPPFVDPMRFDDPSPSGGHPGFDLLGLHTYTQRNSKFLEAIDSMLIDA